jgi:acetylornithine deacetylase
VNTAVEQYRDQMVQWTCDLIRFPSYAGNEQEAQAYLKAALERLGFAPEYREIPESLRQDEEYSHADVEPPYEGRHNLVLPLRGTGGGRSLILQTHTDIVPAHQWKEAYTPEVKDGKVIGRGATDCKGQIAVLLASLAVLRGLGVKLQGDLECQFVIDEEVGGNGALALIRQGCRADGVIVLEGSGLDIHPGNRGAIWFQCATTGISLHMGRRHEGVNAIEKMMEAIRQMLIYEEELIAASQGQPLFARYANPVQLCLGMIRGGEWPSRVCDR